MKSGALEQLRRGCAEREIKLSAEDYEDLAALVEVGQLHVVEQRGRADAFPGAPEELASVTVAAACGLLGIGDRQLRRYRSEGKVQSWRVSGVVHLDAGDVARLASERAA